MSGTNFSSDDRFDSPAAGNEASGSLGSLPHSARTNSLRSARITMSIIGALTVIMHLVFATFAQEWADFQFNNEIQKQQELGIEVNLDEAAEFKASSVRTLQTLSYICAGLGLIYFVLGALVYHFPVPCTVLALTLYVVGQAIEASADPTILARGLFIKIIAIVALIKGIQAAVAYQREKAAVGF